MLQLRRDLFTTRVARRIILLFATVAVVPLVLLAGLSLQAVSEQLRGQSQARMEQVAKSAGMALAERLQLLEAKLRVAASGSRAGLPPELALEGFLEVRSPGSAPGSAVTADETAHLAAGGALLRREADGGILLGVREGGGTWWGRVDPVFLWSTAEAYADLATLAVFCVLVPDGRPLHCDSPLGQRMANAFPGPEDGVTRASFEWEVGGREYLASYWRLFLQPSHLADSWTVVVSEDRNVVFQAMDSFRLTLPLALLAGLTTVLLLANVQIRRTTEPIEELQEGTRRVAARQFDVKVDIRSGDEFEELGAAFNQMGDRLALQFRQLEAAREIDQAVLSSIEPDQVIRALLTNTARVVPCHRLGVLIIESEGQAVLHTKQSAGAPGRIGLAPETREELTRHSRGSMSRPTRELPAALRLPARGSTKGHSLVLPMTIQRELRGAIVAERDEPFSTDERERGRQVADQAGVALSGAWLLSDLEEMSWGTLRALAGAIDAKSPWTGGHSERVARLSVALGQRLGLSETDMLVLERGALLHDVGKIGIPSEILDRAGQLDEEAMHVMRQHVHIGVRILRPIQAFHPMLPLVLQHHERWNGSGYPEGRTGPETHRLARILAVADAYDALISPRPYRGPLGTETVLAYMEREAGSGFDPDVVQALLGVVRESGEEFTPPPGAPATVVEGDLARGDVDVQT